MMEEARRMKTTDEGTEVRELDHRGAEGIEVSLLWDPLTNSVFVAVVDDGTGAQFEFDVDPVDALEAFRHPYAYARGAEHKTMTPIRLELVARARPQGETR
jgi:hypothetical protein